MKMLKHPVILLLLVCLTLMMIVACQKGEAPPTQAGGGSNTGNALSGRLLFYDYTKVYEPITGKILILMYDPEAKPVLPFDSSMGLVFSDTLFPDSGIYHIDSIPYTTVNLEFRNLAGSFKRFKPAIMLPKNDTLNLGTDTLFPVFSMSFQVVNNNVGDTLIGYVKGSYYMSSYIFSIDSGYSFISFSGLPVGIQEFFFAQGASLACGDTLFMTQPDTSTQMVQLKCP